MMLKQLNEVLQEGSYIHGYGREKTERMRDLCATLDKLESHHPWHHANGTVVELARGVHRRHHYIFWNGQHFSVRARYNSYVKRDKLTERWYENPIDAIEADVAVQRFYDSRYLRYGYYIIWLLMLLSGMYLIFTWLQGGGLREEDLEAYVTSFELYGAACLLNWHWDIALAYLMGVQREVILDLEPYSREQIMKSIFEIPAILVIYGILWTFPQLLVVPLKAILHVVLLWDAMTTQIFQAVGLIP